MANFDFLACENGDEPFVDNDDNGQGECRNDEQMNVSKQKVKACQFLFHVASQQCILL